MLTLHKLIPWLNKCLNKKEKLFMVYFINYNVEILWKMHQAQYRYQKPLNHLKEDEL